MTKEEFKTKVFQHYTECLYKGIKYPVVCIDREESLIALPNEEGIEVEVADQMTWVRCENVELIN